MIMTYKEIIGCLIKTINFEMEKNLVLLKRMPFESLTNKEQGQVIMSEIF